MTSPSPLWQTTVSVALAGTDRQPFQISSATGSVELLVSQLDPTQPEAALLSTAGCLHLVELAGQPPLTITELPDPADPEDQALCSPHSSQVLSQMLEGQYPEFLPEWLQLAQARSLRVPAAKLPALLDWGGKKAAVRASIRAVLGKRGIWLAAQNPEWSYVRELDPHSLDPALWQTGSRAARSQFLTQLRHSDPDQAREWLLTTWKQDPAADRAAFLDLLGINLSLADEPFLESALNDRSKEVRQTAIALLNKLPDSRLMQRMTQRIRDLVSWRHHALEVTLPEAVDPASQRDGIESKGASIPSGMGERSGWLLQIIAAVPLNHWLHLTQQTPSQLLALAQQAKPFESVLTEGWTLATQRQADPVWAEALVMAGIRGDLNSQSSQGRLLALLSQEQQQEVLARHLASLPAQMTLSQWLRWLGSCRYAWNTPFTDRVFENLTSIFKAEIHRLTPTELQQFLQTCLLLISPESVGCEHSVESLRGWLHPSILSAKEDLDRIPSTARDQTYWQRWREHQDQEQRERALTHFQRQIAFRREMMRSFG